MKTWTLLLTLALILVLPAASVGAAPNTAPLRVVSLYVVNNLLDPGVVTCAPAPGQCSLRAAMGAANMDSADSTITFSVTGIISLSAELPRTTEVGTVTTIDAGTNWIDINGNDGVRHFTVEAGAGLTLKNLVLEHGRTTGSGGIIYNQGTLTVVHCSFLNSQASRGGAIYNYGTASTNADVSRSYFALNSATENGGAIFHGNGSTTVTNSTFFDNTAPSGAAVINGSGWTITITNSTITGNHATGVGGGAVFNSSGLLRLRNTIVANPAQGANCSGTINNQGNNIDSAATCGWGSNLGSKSSTNPKLLSAGDSGPSTTFGLDPTSPAVDGVTNDYTNCPTVDQRGVARPLDGNNDGIARCDIGAYELMPRIYLPLIIR